MFEGLLKPKFSAKCQAALKLTKTRIDAISKKRRAVERFMKNDIAELLRNGLDYNAFGRAERLLIEQDRSACYEFIDQHCADVLKHLSVMQKQKECPEECREAVPCLIYAAARLADLPELRDLRTLFTEKYGKFVEPVVNQEFVRKLKGEPASKETKLQLIHDIAQEFAIDWDSKALEQRLFKPPSLAPQQVDARHEPSPDMDKDDETIKFQKKDNHYMDNKLNNLSEARRSNVTENKHSRCSSSDNEFIKEDCTNQELLQTSSSSTQSVSEDDAGDGKAFGYKSVPPPYVKAIVGKERNTSAEPAKPSDCVPRSVRRRNSKLNIEADGSSSVETTKTVNKERRHDERDEEEKMIDDLLIHYSSKQSSYEPTSQRTANLKPPPERTRSFPTEQTTPAEIAARGHVRAASFQPEMLPRHVHPRLPDYDNLAAWLAVLRGG